MQGAAVETEVCGNPSIANTWECIYGIASSFLPSNLPSEHSDLISNSGIDCRCGCIVHLNMAKPHRIITASAQSCPGRTFWLLQADIEQQIRVNFEFFRLICSTQYVRIRDGDSLSRDLIGEFIGGAVKNIDPIISSGPFLLIEFYSTELSTIGHSCKGGFLLHAQQMSKCPCCMSTK